MRRSRRPIIIASRRSPLAQAQAHGVGEGLARLHPQVSVEYRWIESEGDQRSGEPLADAGGKGLFTRAIEKAVLAGEADVAVHSLKDLPAGQETPGLIIAAIPLRADVRDCLITHSGVGTFEALPRGAVLGTASPRRAAQALRLRPDLEIKLIRGNIESRLRKVLEEQQYAATLMAVAGLTRGGLTQHARFAIDPSVMLPAACQGALALQCRSDDHVTLARCLPLNDAATAAAVHAERQLVAALRGDCDSAIAVLIESLAPQAADARLKAGGYRLRARVLSADGQTCLEIDETAPLPGRGLAKLVRRAAASLREMGADALLAARRRSGKAILTDSR